jgi:hypothetical protein
MLTGLWKNIHTRSLFIVEAFLFLASQIMDMHWIDGKSDCSTGLVLPWIKYYAVDVQFLFVTFLCFLNYQVIQSLLWIALLDVWALLFVMIWDSRSSIKFCVLSIKHRSLCIPFFILYMSHWIGYIECLATFWSYLDLSFRSY